MTEPPLEFTRQTRSALARVLGGIQMQRSVKDPVKQRAAQARWRDHNAAKAVS
jgi:hypothetical protein